MRSFSKHTGLDLKVVFELEMETAAWSWKAPALEASRSFVIVMEWVDVYADMMA